MVGRLFCDVWHCPQCKLRMTAKLVGNDISWRQAATIVDVKPWCLLTSSCNDATFICQAVMLTDVRLWRWLTSGCDGCWLASACDVGNGGQYGAVDVDSSQEDALVEKLVVVVQQDGRVVHRGEAERRNVQLQRDGQEQVRTSGQEPQTELATTDTGTSHGMRCTRRGGLTRWQRNYRRSEQKLIHCWTRLFQILFIHSTFQQQWT